MADHGIDKRQDSNQAKGRLGELLAAFAFPSHWVVRPLPHDYGIDLQVEIFNPEPGLPSGQRFRSTGGHFSCQVKTTDQKPSADDKISFSLRTADLHLSDLMGAASPLLLLLVERSTKSIHYVCLTDYVDKILTVSHPNWRKQSTTTIYIPRRNEIRLDDDGDLQAHWQYFAGLGLRANLYAAANRFHFVGRKLHREVEDFMQYAPYPLSGRATLARRVESIHNAWQEALGAVEAPGLSDLRASHSPVAGVFANVDSHMEAIQEAYAPARAEVLRVLALTTPSESEFLAAQRDFELAATRADVYFGAATVVGDVYEETHRLVGLFPDPIPYDIVR